MYIAQILKINEQRPQNIVLKNLHHLEKFIEENRVAQLVISVAPLVAFGDYVDESEYRMQHIQEPDGDASRQCDNVDEECKDSDQ